MLVFVVHTTHSLWSLADRTIVDLAVSASPALQGQETVLSVSFTSGTEIDLFIDWGDETSSQFFLELHTDVVAYNHSYAEIGDHSFTVRASNTKNSLEVTETAAVDLEIGNVNVSVEHAEVGGDVLFYISVDAGTRLNVFLDFADGLVQDTYYENSSFIPSLPFTKNYTGDAAIYNVTVRISNSVSLVTVQVEAAVAERIADLDVTFDNMVSFDAPTVVFKQTITAGSHMTCGRYFGDDILWIVQHNDPPLTETYEHNYTSIGSFDFVLRCYNYLDYFIFITYPINVLLPIEGASVSLPNATVAQVPVGQDLNMSFCFTNGTNVSCSVRFDEAVDDNNLTYTDIAVAGSSCGYYSRASNLLPIGEYQLKINCSNGVSEHVFETIEVIVGTAVTGLNVSDEPIYAIPSADVILWANISDGSDVIFVFDLGDGSPVQEVVKSSTGGPLEQSHLNQYSTPGYYTATITAKNKVSSLNATVFVGIEYPVNDSIELTNINVTNKNDTMVLTLEYPAGVLNEADSTKVVWNFTQEGGWDTLEEWVIIGLSTPYKYSYIPGEYGDFTTCATVANNVSSVHRCVSYQIGLPLEGFDCYAVEAVHPFGEDVAFMCESAQGSTVSYRLDYGEGGELVTTPRTETLPDRHDYTSLTHPYSAPGIYTIIFQAVGNSFVPLLEDTVDIAVLKPVGDVSLTCDKAFVPLNERLNCEIQVSEGSQVRSKVTFKDNPTSEEHHPQFDGSLSGVQFSYTYQDVGNYSLQAHSMNDINEKNTTLFFVDNEILNEVIVQEKINSMDITARDPLLLPNEVGKCTIYTATGNFPTDVFCEYSFPDGVSEVVYSPQLMTRHYLEYPHTFPSDFVGTHTVFVNCTNFVSYATADTEVTFMQAIVLPHIEILQPNIKKGQDTEMKFSVEKGSHHTFEISYGDGETDTLVASGDSLLNGSLPMSISHTFSHAFNYTVSVRVFNSLSEASAESTVLVVVQEDLSVAPLLLSSDEPVGYPAGDAHYTLSVVHSLPVIIYKDTWIQWDFGDGIAGDPIIEYVQTLSEDASHGRSYQFTGTHGGQVSSQVNVSNLVSFKMVEVSVKILERVEGCAFTTPGNLEAFPSGQDVSVICSISNGTEVVFSLQTGDDSEDLTSTDDAQQLLHTFNPAYALPSQYTVVCNASNAVSSDSAEVEVVIQNAVDMDDITFDYSPNVMISYATRKSLFELKILSGSKIPTAVDAIVDTGDQSTIQQLESLDFPFDFSYEYDGSNPTHAVVNITLYNLVSTGSKLLELGFQQELVGLTIIAPATIATGSPALVNVSLDFGSNYTVSLEFGDGVTTDIVNDEPVYFLKEVHSYSAPGEYVIKASAQNDVMSSPVEALGKQIIVQNEVPQIAINSEKVVPITGGPNFVLIVDKLYSDSVPPTDATITVNYGDSSAPISSSISLENPYEVEYTYLVHGEYTVSVEVSNAVSSQMASHVVVAEEEITNLEIQVMDENGQIVTDADRVVANQLLFFSASYSTGTNVSLEWRVDGVTIGTNTELEHSFSDPGDVQVGLAAMNGLGQASPVVRYLSIQKESNIESFIHNTSTLVDNDVTFAVLLKEHSEYLCFELQTNTSTLILKNWFGPTESLCQGRADFDSARYEEMIPKLNYETSLSFDTQGLYSVVLTMVSSDGVTVHHDTATPLEVFSLPCFPPTLSLFGNTSGTIDNPLPYLKANEINAPNSGYNLVLDCNSVEDVETNWKMFGIDDKMVEEEIDPVNEQFGGKIYNDRIVFPEKKVPYGLYKFLVHVNMLGFPAKAAELEFYVEVNKSSLVADLPSFRRVGNDAEIDIDIEEFVNDPDEAVLEIEDFVFEWFCGMVPYANGSCPLGMQTCDNGITEDYLKGADMADIDLISIPRTDPGPFTQGGVDSFSGCFGDGPGRLDLSYQYQTHLLSFHPGHMLANGIYNFVVRVTKDSRETWTSMQLEVVPGEPPGFSIDCFRAVSGYSSFCRDNIYMSAKLPFYLEIDCPHCPADSTEYQLNVYTEAHTHRRKRQVRSPSRKRRNAGIMDSIQLIDVEGHKVIHIPGDTLPLGHEVTVEVTTKIPDQVDGKESLTIVTSGLPTEGTFSVQPTSGQELVTLFDLTYSGWLPYDLFSLLDFSYEACAVNADDTEDCSPVLVPMQTTLIPGREDNDFKVRVRLTVTDQYSNVLHSPPIEIRVDAVNDSRREGAIDSIDANTNPTVALNLLLTLSAGIDDAGDGGTGGTDGGTGGTDGGTGGTDGGTGGTDGGTGGTDGGTGGTDGGTGGTDGGTGGTDEEQAAAEEAEKQQQSLAKMMGKVNELVLENEEKVPVSPEVKLEALTVYTVFTDKMTKDIPTEAQLGVIDFVENLADTVDLAEMDADSIEDTATKMLTVLGTVAIVMEQEVEVEVVPEVDPESIPDPEAEEKQRDEAARQQEETRTNALRAAKIMEETSAKLAKARNNHLILNAPATTYGNDDMEVTMQKATASALSNATIKGPEFHVVMPIMPDIDEIIFMQLTYAKANVLSFEESAVAVSTGVQQIRTVDAYDQPIDMGIGPDNPFKLSYPSNEGAENWVDMSDSTFDSVSNLVYFYVPIAVNNSAYSSCLSANDSSIHFVLYIKFNVTADTLLKPNQTEGEHDWMMRVPDHDNPNTTNPYCYLVPQERLYSPGFMVGLDILNMTGAGEGEGARKRRDVGGRDQTEEHVRSKRAVESNQTVPEFQMNAVLTRCRAWDSEVEQWVDDKCHVAERSTPGATFCECTEMPPAVTAFAGGITVPQVNSINFQHVFSNFASLLSANPTVFATIISLIVLYCLLVVWARHSDKNDVKKWGVTPLVDNKSQQDHFYKVSIFTGLRKGAGTKSKVCFILSGEKGDTGIRIADDGKGQFYKRGSVRHFVMSTDFSIGSPTFLRVWHDNSGKSEFANWYLDKIVIEDLKAKTSYFFLCSRWLAADEDDGQVDRMLPVAGTEEIQGFNHLFFSKARKNLTDEHLWISLISRPTKSSFTRAQRLTCCLSLLFTTMLANAMFFRTSDEQAEDADNPDTRIRVGPIVLSANSILTSVFGSLVALPVNIIIVQFFRKSKPRYWREEDEDELHEAKRQSRGGGQGGQGREGRGGGASSKKGRRSEKKQAQPPKKKVRVWKQKYPLPRFCVYVGWGLAVISIMVSAFFVILYSLDWGETKSLEWLSALVFSFFQSVALIQPVKIVVLAATLSLLFKTLDELDDDQDSKEVNAKPQEDEELEDPIIRLQQAPIAYIPKPPSKKKLEAAKKAREFEKKMWNIVKEVIYYFLFLLLISFIAWGNKADIVYKMNEHIKGVINTGDIHGDEIRDGHALWAWLRDTAVPSIFYDRKYNGQPTTVRDRTFMSDMVSYRVGAVRLRQLRILPALCDRPKVVEDIIGECNLGYSLRNEEDRNFTMGWDVQANSSESDLQSHELPAVDKAFKYFSMLDLKGFPYWGKMATYGGGGYVADLGTSSYGARKLIDQLRERSWIDHYTRAVFLEFTVYNPGINLFAFVNYLMEFPAEGSVQPSDRITSFQVYSVVAGMGAAVVAAQLIYCVVLLYFIVREIMKWRKERKTYWKDAWNWLEFSVIVGSVVAIAMFVLREKFGRIVMDQLREDTTQFTNYSALSLYNENIDYLVGFLVFLANIKFLKLLRFNKHVSEFSATIKYAGKDLYYFAIIFFILFTAFAIWGYVIFGKTLFTFSNFIYTLETMLSMLLGKFEFNNMEDSYKYLGKIYFISFTIMVFFIVLNMLLGIITMAYEKARTVPQDPMADYKVFGFLWKKIQSALHIKVKSEEHGEGYMSYQDTIDMRLSALDQHVTHMYREYLDCMKKRKDKGGETKTGGKAILKTDKSAHKSEEILTRKSRTGSKNTDVLEKY